MKDDFKLLKVPVPTSVLRTTGYGPNLFAIEGFIDDLAHLSGKDPYLYRRDLLGTDERALKVLDLAAEKSQWREPLKPDAIAGLPSVRHSGPLSVT
jgi:isoquinoline 1-oxidoreductase subunit beta